MSSDRYRNWKFVIWMSSAPIDYIDRIDSCGVPVLLSPVHNLDPDGNGGYKTPHRHGILIYSGKKSLMQALEKVKEFGDKSINTVFPCDDLGAATRYLCHLDHPGKHVYPVAEIRSFNGASIEGALSTVSDLRKYDIQIYEFIRDNNVLYYHDLAEYCSVVNPEWRDAVVNRTVFWTAFLKARSTAIDRGEYESFTRKIIEEFYKL